jgi:hypothetical protein
MRAIGFSRFREEDSRLSHLIKGHRRRDNPLVMQQAPLISVVDDDESVRESLPGLLEVLGFTVRRLM